jgi:aryl-alcohol dehydrogenase-like predicted oxidoreductase
MADKVRQLNTVAQQLGCPLAEVAIRFCVSNPHVAITIPGIRTPEQARANAAACERLPASIFQQLQQR